MEPEIRKILQAHSVMIKMFFRRDGSWVGKMADGSSLEDQFDPPKDDQDLRAKSKEIFDTNSALVLENSIEEKDLLNELSGIYGSKLVQWVWSLSNNEVQKALGIAASDGIEHITVVWTQTQTAPSKPLIEQAIRASSSLVFESFDLSVLTFDVTEHTRVPKHRLISDPKERKAILDGYSITEETKGLLPALLPSDAVCRYYAFPKESIIEVTRTGAYGPNLAHRVVSDEEPSSYDEPPTKREVVPRSERKFSKYMTPSEYAMAIAATASSIIRSAPPDEYLNSKDLRLLKIAKAMVDDQRSDVAVVRHHINSNKEEHWHLSEMVLPKVS